MELFLQILSATGFVLLIILIVIAALIALVLFMPVVYKVKIKKEENFDLNGNVRWLFGAVYFSFLLEGKELVWSLRVFGFSVLSSKSKKKNVSAKREEYRPAKKQPTIKPGERVGDAAKDSLKVEKGADRIKRVKGDEAFEEPREPSIFEKIRFTFKNICDKLKKVKEFKELFKKVKPMLIRLLKAVFPKRIYGYIDFGFDDPATTGTVCAVLGALCVPIPEKLKVTPYFNEKKFECDVNMKGRIFIIILLVNVVKILMVPDVRKLLKDALPSGKGGRKKRKYKNK